MTTTADTTLYEDIAARLRRLIERGAFRPGERLPSVRRLSREQRVSPATVIAAYRLLEREGAIEARPQSGHYVRLEIPDAPAEPARTRPPRAPARVSVVDLVMMLLRDGMDRRLVPLGAAIPNPAHLPVEALRRAMSRAARRHTRRGIAYEFFGVRELRAQIAKRALAAGAAIPPDEVVMTNGAQEALHLCLRAACKPGDAVAVESPAFYGVLQALERLGLRAVELPTHPRDGIDLAALRDALDRCKVRACVITNVSNPLGSCMPDEPRRELVAMLAAREVPLIEDDVYGDLAFEGRPRLAKSFDGDGLVLLCSSFSKTLAPGYRVGWAAAGRFADAVAREKVISSIAGPGLPQLAIAEVIAGGAFDRHLRRLRATCARQVACLSRAVARHFPAGTRISRPLGGYLLWVELPKGADALALYGQALKAGIAIAPGPLFGAREGAYRNFVRLNAAWYDDATEKAIEKLGRMAAALS